MRALAEGKDPTSNVAFTEDTILNSKLLQNAFSESASIFEDISAHIDEINSISTKKVTNHKLPFYLLEEEHTNISISKEPISISRFTYEINNVANRKTMKKLRAVQITEWLTKHQYLEQIAPEYGAEYKVATELGEQLGIHAVHKTNAVGEHYVTNLYNAKAQRFIVEEVLPQLQKVNFF